MLFQLVPILVLVVVLTLGAAYTLAKVKYRPNLLLPLEQPAFKNAFGWITLLYGVVLSVLYAVNPGSVVELALAVSGVLVGASMLLSPSYSEMNEVEKRAIDRRILVATVFVVAYAVLSLSLAQFADERLLMLVQLAFIGGLIAWVSSRLFSHRRH